MKTYLFYALLLVLIVMLLLYVWQQLPQANQAVPRFVSLHAERQTRIDRELAAEEHLNA